MESGNNINSRVLLCNKLDEKSRRGKTDGRTLLSREKHVEEKEEKQTTAEEGYYCCCSVGKENLQWVDLPTACLAYPARLVTQDPRHTERCRRLDWRPEKMGRE